MVICMDMNPYKSLVEMADAYAGHKNLTHWRVSYLVRGDGGFFDRLSKGGGCTLKTASKVSQWFSDNWPHDLDWPADIPRPNPTEKEAA